MNKKISFCIIAVLLLFAGLIALTQETEETAEIPLDLSERDFGGYEDEIFADNESLIDRVVPEWMGPARWFRSNAGGMALEETFSRLVALRNEHALVIDFAAEDELPEYLLPYFKDDFFIEIRILFNNGVQSRKQWLFRDYYGNTRLIAVLEAVLETETEYDDFEIYEVQYQSFLEIEEEITEIAETTEEYEITGGEDVYFIVQEQEIEVLESEEYFRGPALIGFIEIFDEDFLLTKEYRFFDNGNRTKILYSYNNGIMISAQTFIMEAGNKNGYVLIHTDYFRYSRSSFLRSIERVFAVDQEIMRIVFPANAAQAVRGVFFTEEKLVPFPAFFGELFVMENNRLVSSTDERGRILNQTLFENNEEENIIWTIVNTWQGDRIILIEKTIGDAVLTAEYFYDANDNLVLERNYRNGILERTVRMEGGLDIEELFMNNMLVLVAVWEDGRKISETRINN